MKKKICRGYGDYVCTKDITGSSKMRCDDCREKERRRINKISSKNYYKRSKEAGPARQTSKKGGVDKECGDCHVLMINVSKNRKVCPACSALRGKRTGEAYRATHRVNAEPKPKKDRPGISYEEWRERDLAKKPNVVYQPNGELKKPVVDYTGIPTPTKYDNLYGC